MNHNAAAAPLGAVRVPRKMDRPVSWLISPRLAIGTEQSAGNCAANRGTSRSWASRSVRQPRPCVGGLMTVTPPR